MKRSTTNISISLGTNFLDYASNKHLIQSVPGSPVASTRDTFYSGFNSTTR